MWWIIGGVVWIILVGFAFCACILGGRADMTSDRMIKPRLYLIPGGKR